MKGECELRHETFHCHRFAHMEGTNNLVSSFSLPNYWRLSLFEIFLIFTNLGRSL